MKYTVSVLIPTFNAASYIEAAVESVKAQTLSPMEIIVVDDGSVDHTQSIISAMKDVRYIGCSHQGISASRNKAVEAAAGEWITFLDADDLWVANKLEKQVAYLDDHPDCSIVFSLYENFTDIAPENLTERQKKVLKSVPYPYLASAMIHRSVFEKYGLFDTKLLYGEDTEWLNRLRFAGMDLSAQVDEVLYRRRIHDSNITIAHETPKKEELLSLMAGAIRNARKTKTNKDGKE